jgi:hypothetical protein
MKGIVRVENKVLLINAVQKVFHEPIKLDKWPFDDKQSKIVFITKNLQDEDLIKTTKVLNFKKEKKNKINKLSFSQKDYSNFVNAMSKFDALNTLDR